jgi:hypothetical protein
MIKNTLDQQNETQFKKVYHKKILFIYTIELIVFIMAANVSG